MSAAVEIARTNFWLESAREMDAVYKRIFSDGERIRAIPVREVTDLMLELLQLKPTDKLMEIGTGSCTQTAIWASKCAEVHTVELHVFNRCEALGNHVFFREADGRHGIPSEAPFDAIVCTCGIVEIPIEWEKQLADGGRMVVPIGGADLQRLTLFTKKQRVISAVKIGGYCRFSMMEKWPK